MGQSLAAALDKPGQVLLPNEFVPNLGTNLWLSKLTDFRAVVRRPGGKVFYCSEHVNRLLVLLTPKLTDGPQPQTARRPASSH